MYIPPANFFSGLSGIELPVPKYQFPPAYQNSSRLSYYATFFNSIEVNSSFYKIPKPATIRRWVASVGPNFRFVFKLIREVTHCKDLNFDSSYITKFMETIAHAENKKGCLLIQFPPSLTNANMGQLDNLLHLVSVSNTDHLWKVAVEFRNKSWYNEDVYNILCAHHATLVRHDIPKSATPSINLDADFIYVRFHGPTGNYGGSYTDAFLSEYASYIREWVADGKTVYIYFNNTKGDAFNNLRTLNNLVADAMT
jgi:uncharacterized protein YecE (DUF72 family)